MKTNKIMRVASVLLVAVLLTTCAISSTFAKYTTTVSSSDSARVAKWGFGTSSINFENLFAASYDDVKAGTDEMAIIAPGTAGTVAFVFENSGADATAAPEVGYNFTVSVGTSAIAADIENNANIQFALTTTADAATIADNEWGNWDALIAEIEALDGQAGAEGKYYAPNSLPSMVDTSYTVHWRWTFDNANDGNAATVDSVPNDSQVGNNAIANDLVVTLEVVITAVQVDSAPVQD